MFQTRIDTVYPNFSHDATIPVVLLILNRNSFTNHDRSKVLARSQSISLLAFGGINSG